MRRRGPDCQKTTDDKSARARLVGDSRHLMFAGRTPRVIFSKWLTPLFVSLLRSIASDLPANMRGNIVALLGALVIAVLRALKASKLLKFREVFIRNMGLSAVWALVRPSLSLGRESAQIGGISPKVQSSPAGSRSRSPKSPRSRGMSERSASDGSSLKQVSRPSTRPCSA